MNTISGFYKKSFTKGFTLIELLVVIAIIGLLSTIIAAPITQARKKGRDGKKVADLRQITAALQQYADDNAGSYPSDISGLTPKYLANIPPNALNTTLPKDKYMYTTFNDVTQSGASTSTMGFHLGSKLEATSLSLGDDRDCVGVGTIPTNSTSTYCLDTKYFTGTPVILAGNKGTTGFANDEAAGTREWPNNLGIAIDTASTTNDFSGGQDTATTNCDATINGATACIYDVTN